MRKRLDEKLAKIDRNKKWFWRNFIKDQIEITYQHFMNMLNKDAAMRAYVNKAINAYLESEPFQ